MKPRALQVLRLGQLVAADQGEQSAHTLSEA